MSSNGNESNPIDATASLLGDKGTVSILVELKVEETRFSDLLEVVSITQGTLSKRLDEVRECGLVEKVDIDGGRGSSHAYRLTEWGVVVQDCIKYSGVYEKHQRQLQIDQEYEETREGLQDWLLENETALCESKVESEPLRSLREDLL